MRHASLEPRRGDTIGGKKKVLSVGHSTKCESMIPRTYGKASGRTSGDPNRSGKLQSEAHGFLRDKDDE